MNKQHTENWHSANQKYLVAELRQLQRRLEVYTDRSSENDNDDTRQRVAQQNEIEEQSALEHLCMKLGLSSFERSVLLLCAGMELDASMATLCAAAQDNDDRLYPTFSLALAALPDAHWSAITPEGPLRYWRLIELGRSNGLAFCPLNIDEWTLHYLTGVAYLDAHLGALLTPLRGTASLVPSHQTIAAQIINAWNMHDGMPIVQLCGSEDIVKRAIAATVCNLLDLKLYILPAELIPQQMNELEIFVRLWMREVLLNHSALLIECSDLDVNDSVRTAPLFRLSELLNGPLFIANRERLIIHYQQMRTYEVQKPTTAEQSTLWQHILDAEGETQQIAALVSQFNLSAATIYAVAAEAHRQPEQIWSICRQQTRPRMRNLAQHIEAKASWDDLILPDEQKQTLHEIAAQLRQRATVYDRWGFAARDTRGLGITALFYGQSGTGKTMAAEVLAYEQQLDLYRVDLSAVVSKYIGETEENLRRVFDAAEEGGAILLFDEADALFGKRSEVKDSHDRYANIEVSYLLQRMETYRGLAILTTNMKSALDPAFTRRIRFAIQFPFPEVEQRADIWRRIFPSNTPTEGLDVDKLARLNVAGGNIHTIALNAAFLAADEGLPVRMSHILHAAQSEYNKIERTLTTAEIGGWV